MGDNDVTNELLQKMSSLFFLTILLCVGITTGLEYGTETLLSVNLQGIPQYNPAISGTNIVWSDNVDGSLHLYELVTGTETKIHNDNYIFTFPSTSGDFVVSEAYNPNSYFDIFLYEVSTGTETILTPDSLDSDEISPVVHANYVAWKSYNYLDNTCNVYLYDLATPTNPAYLIAEDTQSCGCVNVDFPDPNCIDPNKSLSPSIFGSYVVWDALVGNRYDLFLYDIVSRTTLNITPNTPDSDQEFPEISGNYVVWQDNRNGNWNVYSADISNISNIAISPIAPVSSEQYYPTIDGNLVVWRDAQNESLMFYNIQTSSVAQITPSLRNPNNPAISGDRIVYEGQDAPGDFNQIYLFTLHVFEECPVANFTNSTPRSAANAPHSVQFNDTSNPQPNVTVWNFGDNSSQSMDPNPEHTYDKAGTYDVSLIVSNPYCRSMITKNNFVTIGEKPIVNFIATPTCGVMPLAVYFFDRSSGLPTGWTWDFNYDGTHESTNRNTQFLYTKAGKYSVNLTVYNDIGEESLLKSDYISVMNRSRTVVNTSIDGLTIIYADHLLLNTTKIPNYILNDTTLMLGPFAEKGLQEIMLIADDAGFIFYGDSIGGNLTKVFITSASIPLEGFSEEIGTSAYVNFTLEMPHYPVNGRVMPYIFEGAVPCDEPDLRKISYDSGFSELSRTAYEIRLMKYNMGTISNMSLNMAVNSSWVTDRSKVWVIRIGDNGTGEVLPTHFVGEEITHHIDIFSSYSPRGPSRFALTILSKAGNPLQIIVLIVQQLFGDISDVCTPVCTWEKDGSTYTSCNPNDCPKVNPTEILTPTPVVTILPNISNTINLPLNLEGILQESVEVQAKDPSASLSILKGTRAMSANGTTLQNVSIRRLNIGEITDFPSGVYFEGIAYEFLPDGATFDIPIVFTLIIPEGIWDNSKEYELRWYNHTAKIWEPVPMTLKAETHTVIAEISHFSIIGLFSYETPTTPISQTSTVSPTTNSVPQSFSVCIFGIIIGVVLWFWRRR